MMPSGDIGMMTVAATACPDPLAFSTDVVLGGVPAGRADQ